MKPASRRPHALARALTLGLILALAGCTPPIKPEDMPPTQIDTPTLTWENGITPTGPLENTIYVQYIRELRLGEALAWNIGDFTIPQLTNIESDPFRLSVSYSTQRDLPFVFLGPAPFTPLTITRAEKQPEDGSERVIVRVCQRQSEDYLRETPNPEKYYRDVNRGNEIFTYTLDHHPDNTITNSFGAAGTFCPDTQVPLALFDTTPTLPTPPVNKPVRKAPYEVSTDTKKWVATTDLNGNPLPTTP
ncbi:hypothetical protein [Mycetocola spongiae]|uniref:hypothetical protein n=1 Tax=Mycetocola spongiae TaxID=2859226 RepID=UPI001CF2A310|nr:hypothetical protein [Mycetocola spongiae]UCR89981.1 hypothetical protein KXZ72_04770 [Mycetocola spongiae]